MWLNIGQGNTTLGNVGGFFSGDYRSSSDIDGNLAWLQDFADGFQVNSGFKTNFFGVRAVRAFLLFIRLTILYPPKAGQFNFSMALYYDEWD